MLELWLQLREEKKFWNLFEQYKGAKKALTEEEENALREDFYKVMSGQPLTPGPGRPKAGQKRKVQPKKKAQNGYKRTILLNGQPLEYILKRSTRKTIGLVISDGVLTVKAPHYEPILWIEKVIEGHSAWIEKISVRLSIKSMKEFVNRGFLLGRINASKLLASKSLSE